MTLADRLGLTDRKGYVPAAFVVTAFAVGVQIALVTEALGPQPYPPTGKANLAWPTLAVIAASVVLHVPWRGLAARARGLVDDLSGPEIPRRSVHLAPYYEHSRPEVVPEPSQDGQPDRTNGHHDPEPAARLKARVHSPLSAGPVVAPGEEIGFTVEAEPERLARDLDVTVEVEGPEGTRRTRQSMPGTEFTHRETFEEPGTFTVSVRLSHPNAEPVAKTLHGRVASYREEIGRLFEALKRSAAEAGLEVSAGSTPREVCRELRQLDDVEPGDLADLAVELEVALYGDEEVDRATYETVHAAIAATNLLDDGPSREVAR